MSVNRILPSDKNSIYLYLPLSKDGEFECSLPLTDASRRERKLTLKKLSTSKPFIPTNVQEAFDLTEDSTTSELSDGIERKFSKIQIDTTKLFNEAFPIRKFDDLIKVWNDSNKVIDAYENDDLKNGLFMNMSSIQEYFDELIKKFEDDYDPNNLIMIFAEIGTKVTESELKEGFDKNKLKLDLFNIYLFPLDFQYPKITEGRTDNGGIEINVGGNTVFTHDVNLRSMIEYVMVDINKGDVRSSVHGSKRSLYYEFDEDSPEGTITKYIWVWSMGNPLPVFDTAHTPKEERFPIYYMLNPTFSDVKSKGMMRKQKLYGRNGSYLDIIGYRPDNISSDVIVSKTYTYHANNFLLDTSVLLNTSAYINAMDNALMNFMRPNSGMFLAGTLNYINNQFSKDVFNSSERWLNELIAGRNQITFPDGKVTFFNHAETIAFHELPNFSVSYYGDDLFLKLNCREVESSTLINGNEKENLSVETILTVIKANDNVYQQFLGNDNQLVVQVPQFRPLSSETPVQSLILRNSNSRLHFRFTNIKDQTVAFIPGDFVYLEFDIEPTGSDGGY